MANYNGGKIYNKIANDGGALYNSATYVITFKLYEELNSADSVSGISAISVAYDSMRAGDAIRMTTLYLLTEELEFAQDLASRSALYRIADSLRISDSLATVIASLFLTERFKTLDSISRLAALLEKEESVTLNEITSVRALIRKIDSFGLHDVSNLFLTVFARDMIYMSDSDDPATAIADFVIGDPTQVGEGDLDAAFDWIMPFGLMMDWSQSVIPRAPEAESDEIQIAGVDGETLEHTRYRNRQFKVVAWSDDDLSLQEKDALVRKITSILDSTKNNTKKLTFARTGVSFDVKYDGELAVEEGPSFIRAIVPLTASAYGYNQFDKQLAGSGLIQNAGVASVGVLNAITGECVNPAFSLGDSDISWTGTVPTGSKLYIDHGKEVCYLEDAFGNKTNVRQYLSGEFVKVPVGGTIIITANDSTETHLLTTWRDRFLW